MIRLGNSQLLKSQRQADAAAAMKKQAETLSAKIQRVLREKVTVVDYDPRWPAMFEQEKELLQELLPAGLIRRIEHFGSTAVPGLSAKPIIDMLVEVTDLVEVKRYVVPLLEKRNYDYFWRPSFADDLAPYYAWFIKRDGQGNRTHHIHMIESHFKQWDSLLFRDYLIDHPDCAREYEQLKRRLAVQYHNDREGYTREKGIFIRTITKRARNLYQS